MIRLPVLIIAALLTAACTHQPRQGDYGTFATTTPAADQSLSADVVKKLATLYPPARTRFQLRHKPNDPFGAALIAALRRNGYAVRDPAGTDGDRAAITTGGKPEGLRFAYILDQPSGEQLYRITLTIENATLSRVYGAASADPAGYWVKKE